MLLHVRQGGVKSHKLVGSGGVSPFMYGSEIYNMQLSWLHPSVKLKAFCLSDICFVNVMTVR